ncbi:MAG: hypothetical protein KJP00_04840, partial [Bacteroidia bacterium]|nr:hypothetical protein [Bacteroidia bacterium]
MLIPTGSKVVIKFTGEHGQVIKDIDGEMFLVQIDDHPEPVPVHGIDLRIVEASEPMYDQGTSKWISDDLNVVFEKGIYVVFKTADHHIINKRYSIFLANMTDRDLVFEYQFRLTREDIHSESPRLSSGSFAKVGSMMYEDLNEKASIVLSVAELTTAGLDEWKTRTLHLKMKQFFSRQQISKADGCLYHQYLLDGWQRKRSDSEPPKLTVQTKKRGRPLPVSGHHII